MRLSTVLLCAVFVILGCDGAKILGVFHPPVKSHFILGRRLLGELAKRGHEVTMISPYQMDKPVKNFKQCVLSGFVEEDDRKNFISGLQDSSPIRRWIHIFELGNNMSRNTLAHPNVQKLLHSNEKFDLVIIETYTCESHLGLAHHYNAPAVVLSTVGSNHWTNQYTGNPSPSSYVNEFLMDFPQHMTFVDRVKNFLISSGFYLSQQYNLRTQAEILKQYFPDAPDLRELFDRVALVLLNSDISINAPRPLVPSMVEVGGFHIEETKELPKDLKTYLDSCTSGFILFSMGSNFKSQDFVPETLKAITNTFSKLPYKILWKFETELTGKPSNVRIEKWLPQNDVLAHPNLKLFITHGGLLSTTESVYHGIPLVGIPVYGDQKSNMLTAERLGLGKILELEGLNQEKFLGAIKEVIGNPEYRMNVRKRSMLMRDQPLKPIDRAVFWIEHVLRHKGADHLKTGAVGLAWYQLYQLDVIALLLGAFLLAIFFVFIIPYKIVKSFLSRRTKTQKYKSEKKKKH